MEQTISISYPKQLAFHLNMSDNVFMNEIKTLSIIKLYEIGKISSGIASKILNISKIKFIEILYLNKTSYFEDYDEKELMKDVENA